MMSLVGVISQNALGRQKEESVQILAFVLSGRIILKVSVTEHYMFMPPSIWIT